MHTAYLAVRNLLGRGTVLRIFQFNPPPPVYAFPLCTICLHLAQLLLRRGLPPNTTFNTGRMESRITGSTHQLCVELLLPFVVHVDEFQLLLRCTA